MTAPPGSAQQRLDALWREHAPAVVRYARRRVLEAEVDEVVAETFVVAWRRIDDVPAFALPWLLGVARGVSANVRRAARRRDALGDRLRSRCRPHEEQHQPGEATIAEVASALARLSDDDRELLTLIAWDGLTREQVAEALHCSRRTLAVRLHRARRRLQANLDDQDDAETSPGPSVRPDIAEMSTS